NNSELPLSEHHFAIYRWRKHGIKPDEALVAVASEPGVEDQLLKVLQSAIEISHTKVPNAVECDALDIRHHSKWTEARANHIAENRQLVEHRSQSLTVSHRARCKIIDDQIARATDDKIRLMKESELTRANADFNRRMEEIQKAANSADILAAPVVFGTIVVKREEAI
ncbi:MAG: helicase, partial [Methyloprofundus sp.]|nr:helicase [Methyloprofundus sp.]